MIHCPRCGAANQDDSEFCSECGQPLEAGKQPSEEGVSFPTMADPPESESSPHDPPSPAEGTESEDIPDWLRDFGLEAEEGESEGEEGSEESEDEVPDWLKELRARLSDEEEEEEAVPPEEKGPSWLEETPEAAEEVPWLQRLRAIEPSEAEEEPEPAKAEGEGPSWAQPREEAPETKEGPSEEMPSWLESLEAGPPTGPEEPEELEEEPSPLEEEEVPEWLRDLGVEEPTAPFPTIEEAPGEAPPAEEEKPPLPLEMTAEEPAAPAPELEEAERPEEEVPEWLKQLRAQEAGEEAPEPEEAAEEELVPAEIPPWLQEFQPPSAEERPSAPPPEEEEEPLPFAPPPSEAEAPTEEVPVFREEREEAEEVIPEVPEEVPPFPIEAPALVAEEEEEEEEAPAVLPSWLEEERPPEVAEEAPPLARAELPEWLKPPAEVAAELGLEEAPPEGELVRAEIPAWLEALRPPELAEGVEVPVEEEIEGTGLLEGIRGVLPAESIISIPRASKGPFVIKKEEVKAEEAELFRRVVSEVPAAVPVARPRLVRRVLAGLGRWLVYVALALAVLAPLLLGGEWFQPGDVLPFPETETFYNIVEGLPGEGAVLLVFDYDPTTAGEMTPLAEAVVHHLMRRGVRVAAVSLYAQGPAVAQKLLDEAAQEHDYRYGENYINLGFWPYQPAALQALAKNPTGGDDFRQGRPVVQFPIAAAFKSVKSLSLIVELAGNQETLRWWVEQVGAQYGVPMVAGVSGAVEPYARPYYESGQLQALLVGLPAAAEYESMTGRAGTPGLPGRCPLAHRGPYPGGQPGVPGQPARATEALGLTTEDTESTEDLPIGAKY